MVGIPIGVDVEEVGGAAVGTPSQRPTTSDLGSGAVGFLALLGMLQRARTVSHTHGESRVVVGG